MPHKKFEYCQSIISQNVELLNEMDKMGQDGWEIFYVKVESKMRSCEPRDKHYPMMLEQYSQTELYAKREIITDL